MAKNQVATFIQSQLFIFRRSEGSVSHEPMGEHLAAMFGRLYQVRGLHFIIKRIKRQQKRKRVVVCPKNESVVGTRRKSNEIISL